MSPDGAYLVYLYQQMFGFGGLGDLKQIGALFSNNASLVLLFAIPIAFSGMAEAANFENKLHINRYVLIALGLVAALAVLMIEGQTSFIYIQF
jgi:hypothetical protein